MRAALLLFIAAAAHAQPFVGPEIPLVAARHTSLFWPTPLAVAGARDGFAVAWSEPRDGRWHVRVVKADEHGAVVRGPLEMQPLSPLSRHAADPTIAPFGDGFLIAWTEDCGQAAPACTSLRRLDAALNVVADYPQLAGRSAAMLRTVGSQTILAAGQQVWRAGADGSLNAVLLSGDLIDDVAVNTSGALATVSHHQESGAGCAPGGPFGLVCFETDRRTLAFNWVGEVFYNATVRDFSRSSAGPLPPTAFVPQPFNPTPVLASNGCCFLLVWIDQTTVRRLVGASIHAPAEARSQINAPMQIAFLSEDVQPVIASDGEQYLVAWSADHDISAALVRADGTIAHLTIAASPSVETNPGVAAFARDRFVIVYDKGAATVARFVTLAPQRIRSAR